MTDILRPTIFTFMFMITVDMIPFLTFILGRFIVSERVGCVKTTSPKYEVVLYNLTWIKDRACTFSLRNNFSNVEWPCCDIDREQVLNM